MAAPKGNTNALKHGLYSRHYTDEERKQLKQMSWDDLLFEIMAARSKAEKAQALVKTELHQPQPDLDKIMPLLNVWDASLRTVAHLSNRIASLTGENTTLNDSLAAALAALPAFAEDDHDPR
jgi:hypothetical protein